MKALWVSINTTCLEPTVCNIVELSYALQEDGVVTLREDARINPVFHARDALFGHREPEDFLKAYHNWLPTTDPRYTLQQYPDGERSFFYNEETLHFIGKTPEQLVGSDFYLAHDALERFLAALRRVEGRKWTLAGHNVSFLASALQGWSRRADKMLAGALGDLIDFQRPIDTMSFFRTVAAFNPAIGQRGFALKDLAAKFGEKTEVSSKSKLDALLSECGKVISGGVEIYGEHVTGGTLPS